MNVKTNFLGWLLVEIFKKWCADSNLPTPGVILRQDKIGYISASGCGTAMEFSGSYLSMECRILDDHHEFNCKLTEEPKMCLKSPLVTVFCSKINFIGSNKQLKIVCAIRTSNAPLWQAIITIRHTYLDRQRKMFELRCKLNLKQGLGIVNSVPKRYSHYYHA